jgi:hypothetical protein
MGRFGPVSNGFLTKINWIACGLHAILGVCMLVWYYGISKEHFPENIDASLWDIVPNRSKEFGPKLKKVANGNAENPLLLLIVIFTFFTSLAHLLYAVFPGWYHGMIGRSNNYARWIEYSISASMLLVVVCISSGAHDFNIILLLIFATVAIMLNGDAVEKAFADGMVRKTRAHTTSFWSACILLIGVLTIYVRIYRNTIIEARDKIPGFVTAITTCTIILYCSFGFVQFLQIYGKSKHYSNIELSYIILSFVSKALLAILVATGVIARATTREA